MQQYVQYDLLIIISDCFVLQPQLRNFVLRFGELGMSFP